MGLYTLSTCWHPSQGWWGGARLVAVIRAVVHGPDRHVYASLCPLVASPHHNALLCPHCHRARSSWTQVSSDVSMGEGENKSHSGKSSVKDCRRGTLPTAREQAVSLCCGMGEGIPRLAFWRESVKRSCWQGLARPSAGSSLCRGWDVWWPLDLPNHPSSSQSGAVGCAAG